MAKSIKLKNNTYWDSTGIKHNRQLLSEILEQMKLAPYPIGSIYMSLSETSPQVLFGGTWEQIYGRFLLATGMPSSNSDNFFGELSGRPWSPRFRFNRRSRLSYINARRNAIT